VRAPRYDGCLIGGIDFEVSACFFVLTGPSPCDGAPPRRVPCARAASSEVGTNQTKAGFVSHLSDRRLTDGRQKNGFLSAGS